MIQLIAIDMDGTLLNPAHAISPRVKAAIAAARRQGIHVALATGRPYTGVRDYAHELDLTAAQDYCVTFNGAVVQRATTAEPVIEVTLGIEDFLYCHRIARDLGIHFHAVDGERMYTTNADISPHTVRDAYLSRTPLCYRSLADMDPSLRFRKMMMVDSPAVLDAAIPRLPAEMIQRYTVVKSAPDFLEILDRRADKGQGLQRLAVHLGIAPEHIMAIGDHENDLSMLAFAGLSIAMGNAIDAVKQVAHHVTTTNAEDGVALAIENYALPA